MSTVVAGLLEKLRQRAAGGGVTGLVGPALDVKLPSLSVERRLEVRASDLAVRAEFLASIEHAREREAAAVKSVLKDRWDAGQAGPWAPPQAGEMPAQKEVCSRFVARYAAEYGVPEGLREAVSAGNVVELLNRRIAAIESSLGPTYQREGEPAGAVELCAKIRDAVKAEWPLRKAQKEAHEANNGMGGAFEAEAHAANAALWAAEAHTASLRRELYDRWALR